MVRLRPWPHRHGFGIATFAIAVVVLAWIGTMRVCDREIVNDVENAVSDGTNLSRFYADAIGRTLNTADRMVRRVRILRRTPGFDLAKWMRTGDHDAFYDEMSGVFIADMQGHVVSSEGTDPAPSVEACLAALGDVTSDVVKVVGFRIGTQPDRTTFAVCRRDREPDGSFDGVTGSSILPGAMTQVFEKIDLGPRGSAVIVDPNGLVMTRTPYEGFGVELGLPLPLDETPSCRTKQSPIDGVLRIMCYSRVPGMPVSVGVGSSRMDVENLSAGTRRIYLTAAFLFTLGVLATAFLLIRSENRRRRQAEATARTAEALQTKQEILEATLDGVGQGVALFDAAGHLVNANVLAAGWLGFGTPEEVVGRSMDECLGIQAERGVFGHDRPIAEIRNQLLAECGDARGTCTCILHRADGVTLQVRTIAALHGRTVRVFTDVTETLRAEAALGEKTLFLETILENTGEGILVFDREQRLRLVNGRAAALARVPSEAVIGLGLADFVAMMLEDTEGNTSPTRTDYVLGRFFEGRDITPGIRRFDLARDLVIEVRTNALGDGGWVMVTADVTKAHRDAAALQASEMSLKEKSAALEITLNSIEEGILAIAADGKIAVANRRLPSLLDVPQETCLPGTHFGESLRVRDAKGIYKDDIEIDERIRRFSYVVTNWGVSGPDISEVERHPDGTEVETIIRPLDGGGVVLTARDVTRQRAAEAALAAAKDAAEAGNRAKSTFVATMSHEIRTPLNGVLGMSEILSRSHLDATQRECLATIRECGDALLSIVTDILDFSKLEAGRTEFALQPFDAASSSRSVVDIVTAGADHHHLAVGFEASPGVPRRVLTDGSRIRQVLLNLVGNAVKFTQKGGAVAVRLSAVAEANRYRLRYEVEDDGAPIAPEKTPLLFREFSQLGSGTVAGQGGTGLGLAISKRIVEGLGGSIGYGAGALGGNLFWFEIPCTETQDEPASDISAYRQRQVPLRVLLAEDNKINLDVAIAFLEGAGHTVLVAKDGPSALELAKSGHPDVILMDVQLPIMDGPDVCLTIRGLPGRAGQIPIVALTADASEATRANCIAVGMDAFLTKPFSADGLLGVVSSVAWNRRKDRDAVGEIDRSRIDGLRDSVGSETLLNLVDEFDQEARTCLDRFSEGLHGEDASRALHNIKGSAKALGMTAVVNILQHLEGLAAAGTPVGTGDLARAMASALASIRTLYRPAPAGRVA